MKFLKVFIPILIALTVVYFIGPKPDKPEINAKLPVLNLSGSSLENFVNASESKIKNIKPDNEARIVWFDSLRKNKTEYSIVYIHGFSASQGEGLPIHRDFAKRYGCNLYLPRLSDHGIIEDEPMLNFTPERIIESAKQAVAIGKQLGEKVILMSTSTGGTLSLYIASENPDIYALILYSPNIDLYDSRSSLLTMPWGLQISRLVQGSSYYTFEGPPGTEKYWTTKYRIEALIGLKSLVNATMTKETFQKIKQPVFVGFCQNDSVVSVPKILEMYDQLGTPSFAKMKINFPNAGTHCISSGIWSKDVEGVKDVTYGFAQQELGMHPVY